MEGYSDSNLYVVVYINLCRIVVIIHIVHSHPIRMDFYIYFSDILAIESFIDPSNPVHDNASQVEERRDANQNGIDVERSNKQDNQQS